MNGTLVDVGEIIADAIKESAQATLGILGFPFLITQFSLRRDVPVGRGSRMKTAHVMTAVFITGGGEQALHPIDCSHRRVPRAVSQEGEDVTTRVERVERKMDFLIAHQMKLVELLAYKLQLDASQLPYYDEGQAFGAHEPKEEGKEEGIEHGEEEEGMEE